MAMSLCRKNCCPRISFSDDGRTAVVFADSEEDDVIIEGTTVGIRFTREQLQVLVDEVVEHGILPSLFEE